MAQNDITEKALVWYNDVNKAKTLYEGFTRPVSERLKPYVKNYDINLFEIAFLTDE